MQNRHPIGHPEHVNALTALSCTIPECSQERQGEFMLKYLVFNLLQNLFTKFTDGLGSERVVDAHLVGGEENTDPFGIRSPFYEHVLHFPGLTGGFPLDQNRFRGIGEGEV